MRIQNILLCLLTITLFNCEDVIDIDVPTSEPRLVIDASINWVKATTGNEQFIKLTLTAPFFDSSVPPANNAEVFIIDQNNNVIKLTKREREILQLIAEGFTTKEIAIQLNIAIDTVHTHRKNIMQKLDIHKQAGLIRYALKEGISHL